MYIFMIVFYTYRKSRNILDLQYVKPIAYRTSNILFNYFNNIYKQFLIIKNHILQMYI